MALKTFKPITPSLRQLVIVDRRELYKGKPVKVADRGQVAPPAAATTTAASRCGSAVAATSRPTGTSTSSGAADMRARRPTVERHRIRSEPDGLHRADQVCRRRPGLHPGAAAHQAAGDSGHLRRAGRHQARKRHADRQHAGGHDRAQRRAQDRASGGAVARSAGNYAQIVGRDQGYVNSVRLNSGEQRLVPWQLLRHGGGGVEPRSHEHLDGQGGPQPLAWA